MHAIWGDMLVPFVCLFVWLVGLFVCLFVCLIFETHFIWVALISYLSNCTLQTNSKLLVSQAFWNQHFHILALVAAEVNIMSGA